MPLVSINPATGQKIHQYSEMSSQEAAACIRSSHQAFLTWRKTPLPQRAERLRALATVLREDQESFGQLITEEMGKPLSQALGEVEKCFLAAEYYADKGEGFLTPEIPAGADSNRYVVFEPLGVVLAIMPWNFPFWQAFRAAIPTVLAGNGFALKHASNVTGCALAVEKIFEKAGFPRNLVKTVILSGREVGSLIDHPLVAAVTLTGSTSAGREVAARAGAAMKKGVYELGGSDPYLVLEDADLDKAADTCATARLVNGGQSCVSAKRFIVPSSIAKEFEKKLLNRLEKKSFGSPLDSANAIGPLAREDLRDEVHQQVVRSIEAGARLLLGGKVPEGPGFFYPPTLLSGVKKGMPAYDEEIFGPVAAIIPVKDEAEAVQVANDSIYGLGAAIFSRDVARAQKIAAEQIESGMVFINDFVRSDTRLPFGGVKQSGYGRELSSFGIREFVNIKAIAIG